MKIQIKRYLPGVLLCAALAVGSSLIIHAIATPEAGANRVDSAVQASGQNSAPPSFTFAPMLKQARKSVVNVLVEKVDRVPTRSMERFPFPFFDPFGQGEGRQQDPNDDGTRRSRGAGSGVVVSADGYILTNNHVVEDSDEVTVTFSNGRTEKAKVVGTDPPTDLAVLKVEPKGLDLEPIQFANSDSVEVGDLAFAIGNPLGIGQTVTMGIVSATGRTMGIIRTGENSGTPQAGYEDFIQTDAAINRGNSGGALITVDGRLMGINSAIISQSGGNEGIGFAIPMNIARFVMDQLISNGKVQRAMIGALLTEVDSTMAKALGMDRPYGAMVNEVVQGKPAAAAGMKAGDVITKINGTEMRDSMQTRNMISMMKPGTKVDITVNRNGKAVTLPVTLTGLDQQFSSESVESSSQSGLDGVSVSEIPEDMRSQLRLDADVKGVVVTRVSPSSKAAAGGIRPRDVIVAIDRQPVTSVGDFERLMKGAQKDAIFVQVKRYVQGRGWSNFFFGVER
ncbi:MAG: Do family serine endopeptidase [Bryobacterales bacterium]|nr:Do family serine endopeptidase [Bryobacterales bacterium]